LSDRKTEVIVVLSALVVLETGVQVVPVSPAPKIMEVLPPERKRRENFEYGPYDWFTQVADPALYRDAGGEVPDLQRRL
jgi:hypothetical protein